MLEETRSADASRLDDVEEEADRILLWSLQRRASDSMDEERFRILTFAIDRVQQAIDR